MDYADAKEVGRRIAAARAYSGLSLDEMAEALGVSAPTIRRWSNGEENSLGKTAEERQLKADRVREVTNCPDSFFEAGDAPDARELEVRVDDLVRQMDYVLSSLASLSARAAGERLSGETRSSPESRPSRPTRASD